MFLTIRKVLFKTGSALMTAAMLISLAFPTVLQKFRLVPKGDTSQESFERVLTLGLIGFVLLLPITAPLAGFGWLLIQLSCLDKV